jgi:hemerythrin-like domain-containing protein
MARKAPRPDTTEMVAVHRVFRDVFGAADALITPVPTDDFARAATVANLYSNVLAFLKVHHEGEDELVFPLLRERCPDELERVERASGQHHDVEEMIPAAHSTLVSWTAGDDGAAGKAVESLTALDKSLVEHLDAEEQEVLPLCAEHLSVPEWGALPAHGMANFTGDKIWLVLGLLRDRMTKVQRDKMLANMPPPAVEMWTGFGENAYRTLLAEVGPPLA